VVVRPTPALPVSLVPMPLVWAPTPVRTSGVRPAPVPAVPVPCVFTLGVVGNGSAVPAAPCRLVPAAVPGIVESGEPGLGAVLVVPPVCALTSATANIPAPRTSAELNNKPLRYLRMVVFSSPIRQKRDSRSSP